MSTAKECATKLPNQPLSDDTPGKYMDSFCDLWVTIYIPKFLSFW